MFASPASVLISMRQTCGAAALDLQYRVDAGLPPLAPAVPGMAEPRCAAAGFGAAGLLDTDSGCAASAAQAAARPRKEITAVQRVIFFPRCQTCRTGSNSIAPSPRSANLFANSWPQSQIRS